MEFSPGSIIAAKPIRLHITDSDRGYLEKYLGSSLPPQVTPNECAVHFTERNKFQWPPELILYQVDFTNMVEGDPGIRVGPRRISLLEAKTNQDMHCKFLVDFTKVTWTHPSAW